MPKIAILAGVLLILLGAYFYYVGMQHGNAHPTALIPSFVGIIIAACGIAALHPARTKHAMHGAAMFGVLGTLGGLMGVMYWPQILTGHVADVPRGQAVVAQMGMFIICAPFVASCVLWFMKNRRARK